MHYFSDYGLTPSVRTKDKKPQYKNCASGASLTPQPSVQWKKVGVYVLILSYSDTSPHLVTLILNGFFQSIILHLSSLLLLNLTSLPSPALPLPVTLTYSSCLSFTFLLNLPPPHNPPQLPAEPLFSISDYINSPRLSDVMIISEDGRHFYAHHLVLCAQNPIFKNMLDSDLWMESKKRKVY